MTGLPTEPGSVITWMDWFYKCPRVAILEPEDYWSQAGSECPMSDVELAMTDWQFVARVTADGIITTR